MKLLRLLTAAFIAFAPSLALAQPAVTTPGPPATTTMTPDMIKQLGIGTAPTPAPVPIVITPTPPVTQNTVTTTGPVTSGTVIETGTYAGQTLMYVASVAGTAVAGMIVKVLLSVLNKLGVQTTQIMRDKLQEMAVNAINLGAADAAKTLDGRGKVEIKEAAVAQAVTYVQAHGADTLKKLGLDPTSPEAVEAIKARIETAIVDPSTPTAPILDPVGTPPKVAAETAAPKPA